tara:strand:- start:11403 stop:11594 length:192 start_codon:yes stop_codon:yes gene_type:complete
MRNNKKFPSDFWNYNLNPISGKRPCRPFYEYCVNNYIESLSELEISELKINININKLKNNKWK